MDKYLEKDSAYNRLWAEYQKYGSLIVAVDFDDTLYDFWNTGESYEQVRQLVRDLHKANCYIIIWTGNQNTEFVINFLKENNIPYDSINDEAPVSKKVLGDNIPRKVYANVYVDDRAGLNHIYNDLRRLLTNLEPKLKTFYRVCNENTEQGLWYGYEGNFTGLLHEEFSFCKNKELEMDFDQELIGWLSATDNLEDLFKWFTKDDISNLRQYGWHIYKYEASDYKFYDRFQHYVINQETSKRVNRIFIK
jgi:hydroxymethylpyrimidine pyrophosphatase-like HAD family hydrolase